MQTITKLRVYDQRLDETRVKVLSGFEEYGTIIILFDRGVSRKTRFREIDDAPRLLWFNHAGLSSVGNRLKDGSQAYFASFIIFAIWSIRAFKSLRRSFPATRQRPPVQRKHKPDDKGKNYEKGLARFATIRDLRDSTSGH